MTYVKSYTRKVDGRNVFVNGYNRKHKKIEYKPKKKLTDADKALNEVNMYSSADDPFHEKLNDAGVLKKYKIDNRRHEREDPEGDYCIFFKDGSALRWDYDKWIPEKEYEKYQERLLKEWNTKNTKKER